MDRSSIVFAGIAPHPPIMVPEVGGRASEEVRSSINAMKVLAERIIASGAETIVLISPHAPLETGAFVAYQEDKLRGSFSDFRAAEIIVEALLDQEVLSAITQTASDNGYRVVAIKDRDLDHGTCVPLYFLQHNGWTGNLVSLGYTFLSNQDHLKFGSCIREAAELVGKPIALIASGDLSHRLKPDAPAGYREDAYLFDREIVAAIQAGAPERIVNIDPELRKRAGECGYRSMLVAIGATEGLPRGYEVLSYEAPFGVGYLVAQLTSAQCKVGMSTTSVALSDCDISFEHNLPSIARRAAETFIREGRYIKPEFFQLNSPAACFVSIKTMNRELRGCIGTIEPKRDSLEQELITNAINAATRDPRFPALTAAELPYLNYSVDVLSGLEPTTIEDLDPELFGVVVEDIDGVRRGVLLPNIAGVETAEQQIAIAARKAGIPPGSAVRLFRFRVMRFHESIGN
jgi:AmmeMemoRadiSam system protein A/AmmeMemoRadiSam system protein B